ncbi:MAG: transporter substrate-binding protein [Glaciihabitans sp.]|nr:transporter substrate-binding protein [Glaciihabitans sp.]
MSSLRRSIRAGAVLGALAIALSLAACAPSANLSSGEPTATAAALKYVTPGKFTVATGQPAYEPWVVGDKPESGKGFEAAVAYAVAGKLGFAQSDVVWVRTGFDEAIAPGAKNFDVNLQQFSITADRKKAVDFSSPYYETAQAVVTLKGSKAEHATSIADLKGLLIGAASGTTSFAAIESTIKPTAGAQAFNSNDDAKLALKNGQVDAIVLDVPTAAYFVEKGITLGRLQTPVGTSDQFGILLEKGSSLTAAVTTAVDDLTADGTLKKLQQTWLADYTSVPVLQ